MPADVEEVAAGEPVRVACENARRKAEAVDGELVLGVDTLVALDGRIFGKPADAAEAEQTLRALGGRTHEVISGLALKGLGPGDGGDAERGGGGAAQVDCAITRVTFRTLEEDVIRWYVATGEWRERAGGYAIQGRGAALVAGIEGDYLNVVGLPAALLLDRLPGLVGAAR